jgi:biopolymer transport protein ExbD
MRFNRRRDREKPELNMASMIDATFLLLAFFLFTTGMQGRESRLSPNLAVRRDAAGASSEMQPQVVAAQVVDGKPVYRLGERTVADRASLVEALGPLDKGQGLFVEVHPGVSVGFATAAIQAGRDAGFPQVTYVPFEPKPAAP